MTPDDGMRDMPGEVSLADLGEPPPGDLGALAALHLGISGAEANGREFRKRDDDWRPVAILLGPEPAVVDFADLTTSNAGKDMAGDVVLPGLIRERRARSIALVTSNWMVESEPGMSKEDARALHRWVGEHGARNHPRRIEMLSVAAMDNLAAYFARARIHRDGRRPPKLGAWRVARPGVAGTSIEGRFVDAIRHALTPQG